MRPKVLLIAMANSIHTARWIELFSQSNLDIELFPSTPSRTIHPKIKKLIKGSQPLNVRIPIAMRWFAFPLGLLDVVSGNFFRSRLIKRLLSGSHGQYKVVHAMELQHAGYLLSRALNSAIRPMKIIVSNWGSDIYWFQRFANHKKNLTQLLKQATHYSCECQRDIELAESLGFNGTVLPVHPNAGPISPSEIERGHTSKLPSERKKILIKGYTGFVGRADLALKACAEIANLLAGYEIIVYSSDIKSRRIAGKLSRKHGLSIKTYAKHQLSHSEMLELFRQARIYIGISESDGISTSLLDAMASGAFPIQTDTSCANEWITDAVSGFLVTSLDQSEVADKLRLALIDDHLVNNASSLNLKTAFERLTPDSMQEDLLSFYH